MVNAGCRDCKNVFVPSCVLDNFFNMYYNIGLYFIYSVMVHVRWCASFSPISSPLSEGGTEDPPACVASRWLTATAAPQSTPQGAMSASTDSSATQVDQGSENEAPQLSALFLIKFDKKVGYVISCGLAAAIQKASSSRTDIF